MAESITPTATKFHPGDLVPQASIDTEGAAPFFSIQSLPDSIFELMQGRSFKADCTIARPSLRYLKCLHCDLEGRSWVGEMVVNEQIAERVLDILRKLYEAHYPIERMRLVDYYDANDELAMRANNSSAFNFRFISHTRRVSKHGLGLAVDINPLYNPYYHFLPDGSVNMQTLEPATAVDYVDRQKDFPYRIVRGDLCHRLFVAAGFRWGGDWSSCKDYQHFEIP